MAKIDIYLALVECIKNDDIKGALNMFADDVKFYAAVGMVPPFTDKAQLGAWLENSVGQLRNRQWRVTSYAETDRTLFLEGVEEYDTADGHHVVIPYAGVCEFSAEKICAWRDYLHGNLLKQGNSGEPTKDHVLALAKKPSI